MARVHESDAPPAGLGVTHLQAVHRLTAATVKAEDVERIYDAALDVLGSSLGADRAAVLLYDPDGVIRFKVARGLSPGYQQAVEGHSPWDAGEPAPEPVVVDDVAADESLGDLRSAVLAEGIGALAFIPLLYGERLLGKFMVYYDRPRRLSSEEVALARTVAAHIAFALEQRRLEHELRVVADQLGATLNAVSEGITVQGPGGPLLLANDAAAAMLGFSSAQAMLAAEPSDLASRFELLDEDGEPIGPERLPGRAALRGEELPEMVVRWRRVDDPTDRFSLVKAAPVRDEAGRVQFAVNVFREVTEHQRVLRALQASEARLAFLASASRRLLLTALEPRRVLEQVAEAVVPDLADWSIVWEVGADGALRRVARSHRDLEGRQVLTQLEEHGDILRGHPWVADIMAGKAVLVEVTPSTLESLARDDEQLALLRRLRVRSVMLVPLRERDRTTGVVTLGRGADRPPYDPADLDLAQELASRVSAAVENARSFAREHATAETLTRALLPGRLPEIPGVELAARYRAAGDVGGDFYDCFATGDGSWMLVVGDVCGRGIRAASTTGLTRHTIRAAALHASSPSAVLVDVNRLLLDAAAEELTRQSADGDLGPSFCTVCLASVTPTERGARVVVSSGGHPLPFVVRADGEVVEVGHPGSLLGVMGDLALAEDSFDLGPGDALVLFTDGILERRRHGRLFHDDMPSLLRESAGAPAPALAGRVERGAVSFSTSVPDDDMAVLVLSVPAVGDPLPPSQAVRVGQELPLRP